MGVQTMMSKTRTKPKPLSAPGVRVACTPVLNSRSAASSLPRLSRMN